MNLVTPDALSANALNAPHELSSVVNTRSKIAPGAGYGGASRGHGQAAVSRPTDVVGRV